MLKLISKSNSEKLSSLIESLSVNLWFITFFLITSSLTRMVLIILNFKDLDGSLYLIPISLMVGVIFDLSMALFVTMPLVLTLLVYPARWKSLFFVRWITGLSVFLFTFGVMYLGVAELIFFDEFSSRFNYVAVDYLIYPHEVFINIWDTYPVLTIIIITGIISLLLTWLFSKKIYHAILLFPNTVRKRLCIVFTYAMLMTLVLFWLRADFAKVSDNRILNEISLNGIYTFFYSGITNELDYNQYYMTMDTTEAFTRLRGLVNDSQSTFLKSTTSKTIDRFVESERPLHRFNIVLVLEESFGSNFVGRLNPDGFNLTPQFDSISQHGLLFTHIYATGNRTVRGLEASLASFPPIPGRSIVKRPGNENIFTLPSILKRMDYSTVFLYGGLSYFDNFGHFASSNGFDRVIDEKDFKDPVFSTIWGVSDEDLFENSLNVFDSLSSLNKPFFATMITVSNHSPYMFPEGRIPFKPKRGERKFAVRYADYAIGKFIKDAESHSFFDSTLFIFLADHGARVYGSEEIPLRSYEIPILFYNPQLIPEGKTIDNIGSQMDLSPTILDFLGIDYNSMFFGRSILSSSDSGATVLMSHNRDVALLKNDTMVVLGIQGGKQIWHKDSSGHFLLLDDSTNSPLIEDAIAFYMSAYNMFMDGQLHPLDQPSIVQ